MAIRVTCPNCLTRYKVADETAGQTATCIGCRSPIPIPAREEARVPAGVERIQLSEKPVRARAGGESLLSDTATSATKVTARMDPPFAQPLRSAGGREEWGDASSRSTTPALRGERPRPRRGRGRSTEALLTKVLLGNVAVNVILASALALVVYKVVPASVPARAVAVAPPAPSTPHSLPSEVARPVEPPASLPAAALNREPLPQRLMGSGSSFINPLMQTWLEAYEPPPGVTISYLSTGSGKGVDNLIARSSQFACSDAPLTEAQLASARSQGGEVLHLPLAMGAVVAGYNLPGEPQLRFTGPLLADIYLGKIARWNDPAIAALNPGVTLPDLAILVVQRSDKSGTTFLWTDYLSKVSADWKKAVGVGTEVKWPCGEGRHQNEGVANHVRRTAGAVEPSLSSTTAAAAGLTQLPENLCFSLTDTEGRDAYPICGAVWAILFVDQPAGQGEALLPFLRWITHEGQSHCAALNYASLPEPVVRQIERKLERARLR